MRVHRYKPPGWRGSTALPLEPLETLAACRNCWKCYVWSNWWPAGQLQASVLIHPAHWLLPWRRWGTAVLSYDCTLQQLSLSSNTKPKRCCCWQEVCVFWGEMGNQLLLRGKRPGVFTQHRRLHQVAVRGSALLLALCGWCWSWALQSLLWRGRERAGHCWGGRGRMQPMVRRVGGGIVNPNLSHTAVEVRPPCTIYNSRVQSGVCVCLAGIH